MVAQDQQPSIGWLHSRVKIKVFTVYLTVVVFRSRIKQLVGGLAFQYALNRVATTTDRWFFSQSRWRTFKPGSSLASVFFLFSDSLWLLSRSCWSPSCYSCFPPGCLPPFHSVKLVVSWLFSSLYTTKARPPVFSFFLLVTEWEQQQQQQHQERVGEECFIVSRRLFVRVPVSFLFSLFV